MSNLSSEIYKWYNEGLTNRQIAQRVSCHHKTVSNWLKKIGKKSNWSNQPIDIVDKEKVRCSKCKEIKPIIQFQHGRKGQRYEYRFSYCNQCRKKQSYLNLNKDINNFLSDKYNRLVNRCNKRSIICKITKEDFNKQFHRQEGKCFYTNELMICKVGEGKFRNSCSIDKIIPEKGYIKGNVVFSTNKVNTAKTDFSLEEIKKWMPKWYDEIINFTEK